MTVSYTPTRLQASRHSPMSFGAARAFVHSAAQIDQYVNASKCPIGGVGSAA